MIFCNSLVLIIKVFTSVYFAKLKHLCRCHRLSRNICYLFGSECRFVIEPSCEHFLAECHNIWGVCHVEVFMCPELSRCPTASLYLIHNVTQTSLCEIRKCTKVAHTSNVEKIIHFIVISFYLYNRNKSDYTAVKTWHWCNSVRHFV